MKTDFTTWNKRMLSYGFEENKDFSPIMGRSAANRHSVNYVLTLDCAKEISILQRSDKGKQARKYFIEVEKEYRTITAKPLTSFDLFATQLKLAQEQQEEM